jgi:LEA14-like dessication related protein
MPVLHEPIVTLEEVTLHSLSILSLELDVAIRVKNANPLGITIRELPFTVHCLAGNRKTQIACGNTGRMKIAARDSTILHVPVRSENAAIIGALAAFVTRGHVQVTITGTAIIDCLLFGWSVPLSKSLPITMEQAADSLAGQKKDWVCEVRQE